MRILIGLFLILLFSCKPQQPAVQSAVLQLNDDNGIIFLDSTAAAAAIVRDETEQFFEHINVLDMSIQMKRNYPAATERSRVLEDYKDYLRRDVESFSREEMEFVTGIFQELYALCHQLSPEIFPKEIRLVKTKAGHYGQSVYYTRENCIVIPFNELDRRDEAAFLNVMMHELFHIYSRLNPEKRKVLYELIGFKSIGALENLAMTDSLRRRVLLNPDGVNYAQAIRLKTNDQESILAIPLILANTYEFNPERPQFFSYIQFDLYEIRPPYSRMIQVLSNNDGSNMRPMNSHPDFHRQIGDNTGYIIHPDEVLADNFTYVLQNLKEAGFIKRFSAAGQQLLQDLETLLRK